jgi:NADH-quinone oxidoreductase subunit C
MEKYEEIGRLVKAKFPGAILKEDLSHDEYTIVVARESWPELAAYLRDDSRLQFDYLSDLTAVDYMGQEPRFYVVAHVYSIPKNHRIRVKIPAGNGDEPFPSVTSIWKAANWLEREVYDMFGIEFSGHPDLRRILMWDDFEGHPLRKDFSVFPEEPQEGPGIVPRPWKYEEGDTWP